MIKIGITGTVGKTTTVLLLHNYLTALGKKVLSISTSGIYLGSECLIRDIGSTSLIKNNYYDVEKFANNCDFMITELTAEAGATGFYDNICFDIVALTTFKYGTCQSFKNNEDYLKNKKRLFKNAKKTIVNGNCKDFISNNSICFNTDYLKIEKKLLNKDSYLWLKLNIFKDYLFTNLITFEDNLLCFISIIKELDLLDFKQLRLFLQTVNISGRFEYLNIKGRKIIIDSMYDGVDGVKPIIKTYDNIVVACTYNFDKRIDNKPITAKYRTEKGEYLSSISKKLILTNYGKNDGDENKAIKELTQNITNFEYIPDRKEAIQKAWNCSKAGDTILLLGKGDEIIKDNKTDKDIILEIGNECDKYCKECLDKKFCEKIKQVK